MTASLNQNKVQPRNFSRAFEQMCNFIAVSKTGDPRETIKGLITLCLLDLKGTKTSEPQEFREMIETLFGVSVPIEEIEQALHTLENTKVVSRPTPNSYVLEDSIRESIKQNVEDAKNLEMIIKDTWFKELEDSDIVLDFGDIWNALQGYLIRSFRRHGIQTAALIDSSIEVPNEIEVSLSAMLHDSIAEHFESKNQSDAYRIISDFLAQIGKDEQRTKYIAQLADGAFNYYTLEVPAELADVFKRSLKELTILLDTNFLFGIMDLHYNQQVKVSHDLLRVIEEHNLPFKLRYHEATASEMKYTINIQGDTLRSRIWTGQLSRAASRSRNLSGIEQKFHERNAVSTLDVDEFLRPFEHFDQILRDKNIDIYRPHKKREQEQIDLYHEYNDFLERWGVKDKPYETVMHDAVVLEEVRHIRSKSKSSLEAGALFITCDYKLYRFDWKESKRNGHQACVLLPNIFWQILRPFIPGDPSFEKAFAETFALPEFRALSSGGSKACSKMLNILASYKNIAEETAFQMLSNDLLIDSLKAIEDDKLFAQQVENAIVNENNELLEEQIALKKQLEEERIAKEQELDSFVEKNNELKKKEVELQSDINSKNEELTITKNELYEVKVQINRAQALAEEVKATQEETKAKADVYQHELEREKEKSAELKKAVDTLSSQSISEQKINFYMSIFAGVVLGILLNVLFLGFTFLKPWPFVATHKNVTQICIATACLLMFFSVGLAVKKYRNWCLGVGTFTLAVAILSLF